ncbi:GGDEF domain-containing protein [Curvibacter sp. CHRR-16]|uniref:GGDEF domain-containing protein n=1 Tax=Curvibacter sp. CHRR-16 TaxID=2835872 RepID=UPI001BDB4A4D|nr:GGDEF domain-containing protein [Curvibacter sp. CHRR-16]MBT0570380.1 GGDEF domain-containing protein [Curvibacter sp. CHRR-16]
MPQLDHVLPDVAAPDIALRVRADQLRLLFRQSFPAVYTSVVIALITCFMLWSEVQHERLLLWLGVVALNASMRYALFSRYWKKKPQGAQILAWELPYAITLFVTSSLWGLGMLWFVTESSLTYRLVEFIFLLGMAAGAFSHYTARRYMVLGAMAGVLLPATAWFLFMGDRIEVSLGLAALMFMAILTKTASSMSMAQTENFMLTYGLEAARRKAEQLAHTDELTGLRNRRAFMEQAQAQVALCQRQGMPLCVLMIDADHFKQINDRHGHAVGDAVLRHLATLFQSQRRQSDLCGRLGGEEFAMLLPNTAHEQALALAQRLCQTCVAQPLLVHGEQVHCSISIGLSSQGYALDQLLSSADQALYEAKASGRNRVVSASIQSS